MEHIKICIIGCGYVGEKLITLFSQKYKTIGIDVLEEKINKLNIQNTNKNTIYQTTYKNIEECQYICVAVPTELKENNDINVEPVINVYNNIKNIIKPNTTIINESSVSIGMTRKIFGELNKKGINICFSPERIDSGRIEPKYEDIPKIISGIDAKSLESVKKLYSSIFKEVVSVSSLEIAETCKLTENCFRMINIAYINEISEVCQKWNLNVYEVINACSTKPFGYMPFYPTLGVGGNCIPINPYWLKETNECDIPILERFNYKLEHLFK